MNLLVQYGEDATIDFALYEPDGVDLKVDAVHAAGDTQVIIDGAAPANTTNGFTDEGSTYRIVLTAAQLTGKVITLMIVDQDATKVWLDKVIHIYTYGHPLAFDPRGVRARGTAQGVTDSTITLASGEVPADDGFNDKLVRIVSNGTAAANGQVRFIRDSNGTTDVCDLTRNWTINPTGTIVYEIYDAPAGAFDVNVAEIDGLAQAATDLKNNIGNLDAAVSATSTHSAADVRAEIDANSTLPALTAAAILASSLNGSVTEGTVKEALGFCIPFFERSVDGLTWTWKKRDGSTLATLTATLNADLGAVDDITPG